MNCTYKGEASQEGEEDDVSSVCMGEGIKFGGIFKRLRREGVGEDGEEEATGTCRTGVVEMLRLRNAGSLNLPWAFASHCFFFSFLPLVFFLPSLHIPCLCVQYNLLSGHRRVSHGHKPTLPSRPLMSTAM